MTGPLAGRPYPYRSNSLNMFRLFLAAAVLFAHAFHTMGRGSGPLIQGENLGGWAVAGFFVLSGFLITRSRLRTPPGEYLLHRVARIYPAFLVCLLLIAFVFAPIAAVIEHGTLNGYLSTPSTPLQYVWGNIALMIHHYDIGMTLQGVPYPGAWNGSLWTLWYEFFCYIIVWVLGAIAWFRRSPVMAAVVYVLSLAVWMTLPLWQRWGLDGNFALLARLAPFFLGGAFVYFIIDRSGINARIGVVALLISVALIAFVPGWGGQAAAPCLAYGLLWLSTVVPQPRWVAQNDISYGFYIYAWPVQQMTVLVFGPALPMALYLAITVVVTVGLATASWFVIERPAMRKVRGGARTGAPVRAPSL